jgi:hypothetical protein
MHRNLTDKSYIPASGGMNYLQIRHVCSLHTLSAIWTVWTILVDSSLEKEIELWYFDAVLNVRTQVMLQRVTKRKEMAVNH